MVTGQWPRSAIQMVTNRQMYEKTNNAVNYSHGVPLTRKPSLTVCHAWHPLYKGCRAWHSVERLGPA
jgi:hypothetical protein